MNVTDDFRNPRFCWSTTRVVMLRCLIVVLLSISVQAQEAESLAQDSAKQTAATLKEDRELAEKLRTDLEFDLNRRKGFKQHRGEDKIYDQEREKGLAFFLEEEERWNRLREKESREHAKTRKAPMDDFGPEYLADLKVKQNAEKQRESDRKIHVRTKNNLTFEYEERIPQSEETELGIVQARPRYDLRKRARNKWVNSGKTIMGGGSSGSSFNSPFDAPSISAPSPGEFSPPPMDQNFEDIPPPPPPVPYDNFDPSNTGGFDSGFGDAPPPPPPPPPNDPSWDF